METSSSLPSDSNPKASGASRFLANLPSRGFLSSAVSSSNPGGMRVYICEHDTAPPVNVACLSFHSSDSSSQISVLWSHITEGQQIRTNQTNILIRSLQLNKQKGDSSSKDVKGVAASEGSRKRGAEKALNSRASAKRGNNQIGSLQDESDGHTSDKEYYSLTVERLRALLKERGLSPKGKKDELVARLRGV
ncbi:hypothetical protein SADUNF_Sadunf12G0074500 [Salix dunnii]|uniref:SAP domain-containing protein n=1 Tax=Salix dunnii TaxID=1413687 RepID=A0A835JL45_9ROSI|nr:hypothetical protein SADUNF_Sadunf12G0074500 [Salix dunnii]